MADDNARAVLSCALNGSADEERDTERVLETVLLETVLADRLLIQRRRRPRREIHPFPLYLPNPAPL